MELVPCSKSRGHDVEFEEFIPGVFRGKCACGKVGSTAHSKDEAAKFWADINRSTLSAHPSPEELQEQREALAWALLPPREWDAYDHNRAEVHARILRRMHDRLVPPSPVA